MEVPAPLPPRRNGMKASPLRRTAWAEKARAQYVSEQAFQGMVEDLAVTLGWWTFHLNQPRRSPAGFPDLVMFRERVIFAELKSRSPKTGRAGKLAPAQIEMAQRCFKAGAEYYSWLFPDQWDEVQEVLSRGGAVTIQGVPS